MTQSNNSNPFVFPGLGQPSDSGQNPMLTSMEMMRQAWQNLAQSGTPHGLGLAAPPMSIEELDRRIAELRTVENWLKMNLSMLTSTIQGLEVQRATIATLKSFVAPEGVRDSDNPTALEVALGLRPSGQAKIKPASAAASADAAAAGAEVFNQSADAAQAWWGMLQNQFNTLASATAATMPAGQGASAKAGSSANAKSTMKSPTAGSESSPSGPPKKKASVARKASAAAKKTAARKRTAAKKNAN